MNDTPPELPRGFSLSDNPMDSPRHKQLSGVQDQSSKRIIAPITLIGFKI
jgi:hypothetical protein